MAAIPATADAPTRAPVPGGSGLRVAMALYGEITNDSRVLREAGTLAAAGHDVTVYCLEGTIPADAPFRVVTWTPRSGPVEPGGGSPFVRSMSASRLKRAARQLSWLVGYARDLNAWGRWAVGAAGDVDVWHAHDLPGLLSIGPHRTLGARLVYDSHEIYLDSGSAARLPRLFRRALGVLERRYVRRAAALVTVNEAYAEVLQRTRPRRTVIVRNCPPVWSPTPSSRSLLRDAVGVDEMTPLVLYHGVFAPHRGVEQLAEAMLEDDLRGAHLALLGFGDLLPEFTRLAAEPRFGGRVHVVDGVPPDQLLDWVSGADVDVMALERSSLNHWLCTPNKLWESLATGVPVVVSDFPVMHRIVLDNSDGPLGEVCNPADARSIADAVGAIIAAPDRGADLRARCLRAAHDRWNWEKESARLIDLYADMRRGS
jgi:glycosyltransferase involved in cell wall biosynthesis